LNEHFLQVVKRAADEKKAVNTVVVSADPSGLCEVHVICSADNTRHSVAIADEIEAQVAKNFGQKPMAIEGRNTGHWIALDYGSMIVHIFLESLRDYYAIEELWKKRLS
jgi:ribosome-associated protein